MKQKIRINKFLAMCGLGSRRKVEQLVIEKKIKVNNVIITDLSLQIDTSTDVVYFNNTELKPLAQCKYILLNKPQGYLTTVTDPFERKTVMHLLPKDFLKNGIFPVGRLDKDTEGLLLLTNDGDLAYRLTHPKFDAQKKYEVSLDRPLSEKDRNTIEHGVRFREFQAKPCEIRILDTHKKKLSMTISEGKKRQIRITFRKFHYKVIALKRTSMGPLVLGNLPKGSYRELNPTEIATLQKYSQS